MAGRPGRQIQPDFEFLSDRPHHRGNHHAYRLRRHRSIAQQSYQEFPLNDLGPVVNYTAPGSKPSLSAINVDYHETYVQQWNFYIDHTFAQDFVVKAGYVGNHAVGLQRYVYPNDPVPAPGDVQSRRPFQNLGEITEFSFTGQSNFQDLELQAQKRYSNGLSLITSFTWSKD